MSFSISYRPDLDGVRALAVIAVLLFHYDLPFAGGGYVGVDVFFVLSGFLMTAMLWPTTPSGGVALKGFYKRRARRILPASLFVIASVAAIVLPLYQPPKVEAFTTQMLAACFFVANITFWFENTYFAADLFRPLLHYWSLGVEVQFYIVFPLILAALRRNVWLLFALFLASTALSIAVTEMSPKTAFFMMPTRLGEFLLGTFAYLAQSIPERAGKAVRNCIVAASLAAIALCVHFFDSNTPFPNATALIPAGATALLVVFGGERSNASRLYDNAPMRHIGKLSYSIYLWHFPVIFFANDWFGRPFSAVVFALTSGLIFILSEISYRFIEQPFRTPDRITNRQAATLLASALVAAVGAFAAVTASSGLAWKYPPFLRTVFETMQDREPYRCGKLRRLTEPFASVCTLHDAGPGARKVLLWGDSHADAIKPAFERVAAEQRFTLFLNKMNCGASEREGVCASNMRVLADAKDLKIDLVVLHDSNNKYAPHLWPTGIEILNDLTRIGVQVSIVAPAPSFAVSVPYALVEAHAAGVPATLEQSVHDYWHTNRNFAAFKNEIARTHPNVRFIDVTGVACPEGRCPAHDEGKVYYFDSGHLTVPGALRLIPIVRESVIAPG